MEAHNGRSTFVKHARNIGRAYRNQAMELVSICLIFSRAAAPQFAHEDAELRRLLRACDLALRSAAESPQKVTDQANRRFENATRLLCRYFGRWRRRFLSPGMAIQRSYPMAEDTWRPKMMINFVLLRSPLAALHDPETVVVRQMLSAKPSLSEVLWNFGRYKDRARITLEQNPRFYSSLPADESAYTPVFRRRPLEDLSLALKPHDTVYVLVDRPGRVFLESEGEKRSFGNVWMLNGTLIFKDSSGVLEGEQLVRNTSIKGNWWRYDEPVVSSNCERRVRLNHRRLRPILTTPSVGPSTSEMPFDDWTDLSHPSSHSINVQMYSAQRCCGSSMDLDLPPPPPTSEGPEYQVLYTSVNTLNDDVLLSIFNHYRPDDENTWNHQLGWFKLAHVCQRWRHLIYESAFHLDAHILCTKGAPVVDTLSLLPPLPLVIDYQSTTMCARDELGISHALRLRDRVRRVDLHIPPSSLRRSLVLMDELFPRLERLSLSSTADEDMNLIVPKTFLAPNLRHLKLVGVNLSSELPLLFSTLSLVTLTLTNIRGSGYFLPKHLITRLRSFRQLEELSIGFSVPLPHPGAERELLDVLESPVHVTLPKLKRFTFSGVSAYLESLVAQIKAPLLEQLNITLFNQTAFALPHLSHFTNTTEGPKLPVAEIIFERDAVSLVADHRWLKLGNRPSIFSLRIMCDPFARQIDCAAQICSALRPMLSGAEQLALVDGLWMPTDWQDSTSDVDSAAMWRKLLRPFVGAKRLHICRRLLRELVRVLESGDCDCDAGSDPGLLPGLQELSPGVAEWRTHEFFTSFVDARRVAGRPVRLTPSPMLNARPWNRPRFLPFATRDLWEFPRYVVPVDPPFYNFALPSPQALWPWVGSYTDLWGVQDAPPVPLEGNLPAPHAPPVRVEHNLPRPRTTRSVGVQPPPPPKRIRSRIRPSHTGAGSAWR